MSAPVTRAADVRIGCGPPVGNPVTYAQRFRVGEDAHTFLHPPPDEVLERWADASPSGYEAIARAWQLVTHPANSPGYRRLRMPVPSDRRGRFGHLQWTDEVRAAWDLSIRSADALRAKLLLVATPRSFGPSSANEEVADTFFAQAPRGRAKLAWEPADSWSEKAVRAICTRRALIPVGDPLAVRWKGSSIRYFRLHGRAGSGSRYADADFETLAGHLAAGKRTYVLFTHAHRAEDAVRFGAFLAPGAKRRAR